MLHIALAAIIYVTFPLAAIVYITFSLVSNVLRSKTYKKQAKSLMTIATVELEFIVLTFIYLRLCCCYNVFTNIVSIAHLIEDICV